MIRLKEFEWFSKLSCVFFCLRLCNIRHTDSAKKEEKKNLQGSLPRPVYMNESQGCCYVSQGRGPEWRLPLESNLVLQLTFTRDNIKVINSKQTHVRARIIINRGLYILNPLFEDQKRFLRSFFRKILNVCAGSIQERVVMALVRFKNLFLKYY